MKNVNPKQWLIFLPLISGAGTGAYFGLPKLLDLMQNQIDRVDVVIYLMCDQEQECVQNSWKHILEQKGLREAQGGN